ncbi:MAG: F-type H+-transporting ATPase subunit a, partial [Alphaproteobacteria bacterium]
METNPLVIEVMFYLGPVPISRPVVTTWVIMAVVTLGSWLGLRRARVHAGTFQTVLEIIVETILKQVGEIIGRDAWRYLPVLGTLFIFLIFANLSAVVPDVKPPTGRIETPAALAVIVFFSVHYFGVRRRGLLGYIGRYIRPNPLLLPLNVLSELTRTFSLMVRLFGNMMSHELVIAVVVFMAGLLLPIPFLMLGILIGIIQAYIFTVLAAVFIGAAVGSL